MTLVFGLLLTLFVLICLALCLLILIQSDKGGGISGAIGGLSGANNFLGTQDTANILTKGTTIFGTAFLVLCVLMTFFAPGGVGGGAGSKSAMQRRAERVQAVTPMPAAGMMGFTDDAGASPEAMGGSMLFGDEAEEGGEPAGAEPALP
jgi:preprotein translocase subunit SecG